MGWTSRIANAWRRHDHKLTKPQPGQLIKASQLDRWHDYPADGLTPSRLASILRSADEGAIDQAMALFEQMEEKDAHLHCIANTRRLAVTGLPWKIQSAAEVLDGVDRSAADETASFCREVLARIDRLDETLQHLSLAIGRNIAMAENVWEVHNGKLILNDVIPISFDRIAFDERHNPHVLTEQEPYRGIDLPYGKFIVHTPHAVSGDPMRGGLLRVSALAYLGKHFAMKDWLIFGELFGMPLRVARYEPSATPEEKRELLHMLQTLGSDAAAIFSKAVELQLVEAGQGKAPPPYENMCRFFNQELAKAWLGQTLTVNTQRQASEAAVAKIQNEIRHEIREDDITKEGRTIRRDVLEPLVRIEFGPDAPVPFFRRQYKPPRDLRELADVLNVAVNDLQMKVPTDWAHDVLGVPEVAQGKPSLKGCSPD